MKSLFFLAALTLLTACGESSDDDYNDNFFLVPRGTELNQMTDSMSISWDTPNGVGALLSYEKGLNYGDGVSSCTWFLIGKDVALTNSHCIPDILKKADAPDCSKYMQGTFQTPQGQEKRKCSKLIKFSDIENTSVVASNDYAVIKLNAPVPGAPYFDFSREGISENEGLTIHSMNHSMVGSTIQSVYRKHECYVKSSDVFGSVDDPAASPLAAFKLEGQYTHCKSVSGNSGSPVMNSHGKVIGVLHGGAKDKSKRIGDMSQNFAIFTNLRCHSLGLSEFDQELDVIKCPELGERQENLEKKLISESRSSVTKKLLEIRESLPPIFEYTEEEKGAKSATFYNFLPKCIKPLEQWSQGYLDLIESKGFIFRKKTLEISLPNYLLTPNFNVDYYGNLDFSLDAKAYYTKHSFKGLEKLEEGPIEHVIHLSINGRELTPIALIIPQCEPR